jgi:hypothetical protein
MVAQFSFFARRFHLMDVEMVKTLGSVAKK